jgi:hypothetical protein
VPKGGAGFVVGSSAILPHQTEGLQMDMNAWVPKLNRWGFNDALSRPKTTVAFYVAFAVIRWLTIAAAIAVAVFIWIVVSVVAGLFRSL